MDADHCPLARANARAVAVSMGLVALHPAAPESAVNAARHWARHHSAHLREMGAIECPPREEEAEAIFWVADAAR